MSSTFWKLWAQDCDGEGFVEYMNFDTPEEARAWILEAEDNELTPRYLVKFKDGLETQTYLDFKEV